MTENNNISTVESINALPEIVIESSKKRDAQEMTATDPNNSNNNNNQNDNNNDANATEHGMSLRKRTRLSSGEGDEESDLDPEAHSILHHQSHQQQQHHQQQHHQQQHPHMVIEQSPEELQAEESLESGFKTGPWIYEEDERLIQAVGMYKKPDGNVNWIDVARYITDRSQKQCYVRWNTLLKYRGMGTRRGAWTADEDARLAEAVARHERKGGGIFWGKVSEEMGGDRTYQQCLKRWKQVLQHVGSGTRTGAWNDDEDARLIEAMSMYDGQGKGGGVDWTKVSEYLGGVRAPTQCYKRWHDALKQRRKSLLGEDWTPEEDYLIIQAVSIYAGEGLGGGVDWNAVSDHLGNSKTAKQCNKRWNRVLKIKDGVEGRIRTDPWEPDEEKLLFLGVESCRLSLDGNSTTFEPEAKVDAPQNSDQTAPTSNSLFQVHQDLQEQLYHPPSQSGQFTELPSGQHVSFHHLYPTQTELAPGEIHLKSIDWNRVSAEFLQGHRTPRQCEKRFEGLQRQRLRETQYGESFDANRESLGPEHQIDDDDDHDEVHHRMSMASTVSGKSVNDRRSSAGSVTLGGGASSSGPNTYYRHRGRAVKTGPWVAEEDERLIEAVSLFEGQGRGGAVDWGRVCDYMGCERTYDQCRVRWNGVLKVFKNRGTVVKTGPWAKIEDEKLIEAVGIYEGLGKGGGVDWGKVSEYLHGERTPNQCHTRWNSVLKHRGLAMKTSQWTDLEDIKLTEAVGMYDGMGRGGTVDWSKVSEHMGGDRSSYQHRMRWHSVLKHRVAGAASRPTGKKEVVMEPWNSSEIQILLNAVELSTRVNPHEQAEITEDSEFSLHQHHHPHVNLSSHVVGGSDPIGIQMKDSQLDAFDIPGPIAAASQTGAMIAHTIDWIAVSNRVSEEYAMLGGLGPKRTPLQCLYMWRQVMNGRMRMPTTTTSSDIGTVDIDDARMMPGNSFALTRNSPWTDMEDEKLTEAVGVYDGQGRGGGVDWGKVCEFMGSVRTYNQCRHRWHNVIKHRGINPEDMSTRLSTGGVGEEGYHYSQSQDQSHDWVSMQQHQQLSLQHQLLEQQQQQHQQQQQQQQQEDSNLAYLQKYDV